MSTLALTSLVLLAALGVAIASRLPPPANVTMEALTADFSAFQTLRLAQGMQDFPALIMTLQTLVSLPAGRKTAYAQPIPKGSGSFIGIVATIGEQVVIILQPVKSPAELLVYTCTNNPGVSFVCDFDSPVSTTMLPVAETWRDVIQLHDDPATFLLFADTFFLTISCPDVYGCTASSTQTPLNNPKNYPNVIEVIVPALSPDVPKFVVLLGTFDDFEYQNPTAAAAQVWTVDATPTFMSQTFLPPSPGASFIISADPPAQLVLWTSVYNESGDGAQLFRMELGGAGHVSRYDFPFATPGELFVAASVFSNEGFAARDAPASTSTNQATSAAVYVVTVTTEDSVVVYDATVGSEFSQGNVQHGVNFGAISTVSNQGYGYALVGVESSSSGQALVIVYAAVGFSEHQLASLAEPAPSSSCVDSSQPPTCYMSCSPLPSVICSPAIPAPPGLTCFLLPTQPDACNTCPVEFEAQCPLS